ncbi:MAG: BRCT domain-containing protein, partial [Flavobacteriales bacterium]
MIDRLSAAGVQFKSATGSVEGSGILNGLTFVISGTFENHSRDELKKMILDNGAKFASAVSGNTNYLLAGSNMGPAKREKAEKFGIRIIDENEFLQMLT